MAEPTPDPAGKGFKLNILALPSYTSILFALIALVVLGAGLASLLPGSQLWWPPVVLGLTLLPLRDFLNRPDRIISRQKLTYRDDRTTATIRNELASLGADQPPRVLTTDYRSETHAFGTFQRIYLGLQRSVAEALSRGLQEPRSRRRDRLRAILAHEVAHFFNHDVWLVWLSYALLKMMILVMALNLWIGLNLSLFLIENGPEVLRPEFWTDLSSMMLPNVPTLDLRPNYDWFYNQNPGLIARLADPTRRLENWQPFLISLISSNWPFAASGLVLFLGYWWRLLRVRELYADARAASLMGEAEIVREALIVHSTLVAFTAAIPSRWKRLQTQLPCLPTQVPLLRKWFALHPSHQERRTCLRFPIMALGSQRQIAVSVGFAVVLLDFLLRGTLTASYIYEPGPHLPFLAGFLVFGIWLLPRVCLGNFPRRKLAQVIVQIVLLFTFIKLIPHLVDGAIGLLMILGDQEAWGTVVDLLAYSMTGGFAEELPRLMGVEITWVQLIEWHVVRPIAYFSLLMPLTLAGFLLIDSYLKRQALTWYPLRKQVRLVFWGASSILALVLALVIIPIYNRILFPHIYQGWSTGALAAMAVAVFAAVAGGLTFRQHDRRLGKRCPYCGACVTGQFRLGKRCGSCNEILHAWLVANY